MEVEMKIRGLMMDPVTNMPIVILKDVSGNSVLPIWVGIYEANAIALEIEKVATPRPMTHDLIKSLLLGLNTGVRKVVVNELKEETFYALIWLGRDGELISRGSVRECEDLSTAARPSAGRERSVDCRDCPCPGCNTCQPRRRFPGSRRARRGRTLTLLAPAGPPGSATSFWRRGAGVRWRAAQSR